jgi:hypothetical protein
MCGTWDQVQGSPDDAGEHGVDIVFSIKSLIPSHRSMLHQARTNDWSMWTLWTGC